MSAECQQSFFAQEAAKEYWNSQRTDYPDVRNEYNPMSQPSIARGDYPEESDDHLTYRGHHSPENEPRSRRNKGEMEERSPEYILAPKCQKQAPNAGIPIF